MALIKTLMNPKTGSPASYWRPVGFVIDARTNSVKVALAGWHDQQAFDDGKEAVMQAYFDMPLMIDLGELEKQAYGAALALPDLAGAEIDGAEAKAAASAAPKGRGRRFTRRATR